MPAPADFPPGAPVRFTYFDGEHEDGFVSSSNEKNVFVRFTWFGEAQACDPDRLTLLEDPPMYPPPDRDLRAAVAAGDLEPPPATIKATEGPGIATLLANLSKLAGGEHIFLWYSPPPAGEDIRWRVWTGVPTGSGGGEWGRGPTAFDALRDAYRNVVDAIFEGRR